MHHKRGRPKSQRMACMCKYHKDNAFKDTFGAQTLQERKAIEAEREERVPRKSHKKKLYGIEIKYNKPSWFHKSGEWRIWKKYTTAKGRDEALERFKKDSLWRSAYDAEFRAVDNIGG